MPDVKGPKTSGAIIREPETARTPIERKDPTGKDIGEPANPTTAGAPLAEDLVGLPQLPVLPLQRLEARKGHGLAYQRLAKRLPVDLRNDLESRKCE